MLAMAQQQQTQLQLQQTGPVGGASGAVAAATAAGLTGRATSTGESWEPLPFGARGTSINTLGTATPGMERMFSLASAAGAPAAVAAAAAASGAADGKTSAPGPGPTLPPHPKQKSLPPTLPPHPKQKNLSPTGLPGAMSLPPSRLNSLARGLSRGISNLSRGVSVESNASAVLLRNSWEDKFFSMLMLGENDAAAAAAAQNAMAQNMAAMGHAGVGGAMGLNASDMQTLLNNNPAAAAALSARALSLGGPQMSRLTSELSSVSASGVP